MIIQLAADFFRHSIDSTTLPIHSYLPIHMVTRPVQEACISATH